jgi:hypothetical protein
MDPDRIPLEDEEDATLEPSSSVMTSIGESKGRGSERSERAAGSLLTAPNGGGMRLIFDPLDELCRRLRRAWFASATRIDISNIEDHRMDYHFLQLRGTVFGRFPYVRLNMEAGSRYTLTASQQPGHLVIGSPTNARLGGVPGGSSGRAASCLGAPAATAVNASRQPPEAVLLLDPAEEINDVEALFLQEHTAVFKSGDSFHFVHAPWRSFSGEMVRRRYRAIMALIHDATKGGQPGGDAAVGQSAGTPGPLPALPTGNQ